MNFGARITKIGVTDARYGEKSYRDPFVISGSG
jgi:hypothetical protein